MKVETILIIDDDSQFAEFIANLVLPDLGYRAIVANNGREALEILETFQPSLTLLDATLPDIDGLQLLHRLANQGRIVPTILITPEGSDQVALEAFRLGIEDYLYKPVDIEELKSVIARALTETRLRQETARLTTELKDQIIWLSALSGIGQSITSTLDLDEVLRRIVDASVNLSQAEEGFIALVDSSTSQLYLRAVKNISEYRIETLRLPIEDSLSGKVIQRGHPVRMSSTAGEQPLKVATGFLVNSLLHVPILSKGQSLGILSVDRRISKQGFSQKDEMLLTALADFAATAIENANLYQQAQHEISERIRAEDQSRRKAIQAEALVRVAERVSANLDLETVLKAVCEETVRAIPSIDEAAVMLYNKPKDALHIAATSSQDPQITSKIKPVPYVAYDKVMKQLGPVLVIPDVQAFPDVYDPEVFKELEIRTLASASMVNEGELIGCLNVVTIKKVSPPAQDEIVLLQALANQAAAAISNARLFEKVSAAQKRLRALSQKLVEIQEAERRKLARELHDEIGQVLTFLKLSLDKLKLEPEIERSNSPSITQELNQSSQMLDKLINQVREISLDLRPSLLDDLGLLHALLSFFDRYTSQTNIVVNFKHHGLDKRLAPEIETTTFRIVQEALTNVARHANVNEVAVQIWIDKKHLKLQVTDQGVGFDPEAIQASGATSGLPGMYERANLCGGQLEIESGAGQGTCLTAELPIQVKPENMDK